VTDPSDYANLGPYQGIEGRSASVLQEATPIPTVNPQDKARSVNQRWPQVFNLAIKPKDNWGEIDSAVDGGIAVNVTYSRVLDLTKAIWLEIYRDKPAETYNINSIEVSVYRDSTTVRLEDNE